MTIEHSQPREATLIYTGSDDVPEQLRKEGIYTPPDSGPSDWVDVPGGRTYSSEEMKALLDEIRGDH